VLLPAAAPTTPVHALQGPTLTGQNSAWCVTRIICNYVVGLVVLFGAAAMQRWVLSHSMAAAQEWQQSTDPESGLSPEIGPSPAAARPLGPFTAPLYPITCNASPGSSSHSNDSAASTSSGGDVAAMQDGNGGGSHQGWWQLRMPKRAAAAADRAAV
jgi:hypothetical protein